MLLIIYQHMDRGQAEERKKKREGEKNGVSDQ